MPSKKKRSRQAQNADQSRYSRLNAETLEYIRSMHALFKTAREQDNEEEATTIITRTFEELEEGSGEVDIVCDAEASRVLEEFLHASDASLLGRFASLCLKEDNLGLMCTSSPFGSHVLETLLDRVAAVSGAGAEPGLEEVLVAFAEQSAGHLFDMISSKYGSFVARRLVGVLAGLRDGGRGDGSGDGGRGDGGGGAGGGGGIGVTRTGANSIWRTSAGWVGVLACRRSRLPTRIGYCCSQS